MEMPPDFYEFWKFVESVNRQNPLEALVPTCGLRLVGPFQVLAKDPAIFNEDNGDTGKTTTFNYSYTVLITVIHT